MGQKIFNKIRKILQKHRKCDTVYSTDKKN